MLPGPMTQTAHGGDRLYPRDRGRDCVPGCPGSRGTVGRGAHRLAGEVRRVGAE